MKSFLILFLILIGLSITRVSDAIAFEFSHAECDFEVAFPFRPTVKKVVQPLGNDVYSNTYMAQAIDNHSGRVFIAQCDTSFRLAPAITMKQKQQMAEWSISEWSKMTGLKHMQMYWEEQGNYVTLRMVGQRVIVEGGETFNLAFQARMYVGQHSTMMVAVGEPATLSPSLEMENYLNSSVQRR